MRRLLGAALAAAALLACAPTLTGCATTGSAVHAPATVDIAKTMYAAEAGYGAALAAVKTAVDQGYLTGLGAAKARDLLAKAYAALKTARAAYAIGDATTVQDRLAAITALAAQINGLIPPPAQH